jgi:hypothetical protein
MQRWKARPSGVSAFGFGLDMETRPSDAELARGVLAFLEDRRILWEDMRFEIPEECLRSAEKTRDYLTSAIQVPGIGAAYAQLLAEVRQLFTVFMMHENRHRYMHGGPFGPDELSLALGNLRSAVGERIAEMSVAFDLAVGPNLQSVVPDSGRWLWDRFDDPDGDE